MRGGGGGERKRLGQGIGKNPPRGVLPPSGTKDKDWGKGRNRGITKRLIVVKS